MWTLGNLKRMLWVVVLTAVIVWGIGLIRRTGTLSSGDTTLTITDLWAMVSSVSPQNRFVLYRMAVSDRQSPAGFVLNDTGVLDSEGKLLLDYVGVCEVEAWLPMDKVRLEYENGRLSVTLPHIQLYPMVNYGMSFVWKESSNIPNAAVPNVLEAIRNRAAKQAKERGIVKYAQDSAERWFEAFFTPFCEAVTVRFES